MGEKEIKANVLKVEKEEVNNADLNVNLGVDLELELGKE